jgi:hypothetical protein
MKSRIPHIIFFGLLALIALSELFFSNLGTLNGDIAGVANMLGLTVQQERTRLLILIALDAIAGIGALIAVLGAARPSSANLFQYGASMCALGFVAYGIYQFFAALTQLGDAVRVPVTIVGVVYAGIGVIAWLVGRRADVVTA